MFKNRDMLYIAIFLAFVFIIWTGFLLLPGPNMVQLPSDKQGGYNLTNYDFSDTVYVTAPVWDCWPEMHYAPEELENSPSPVPQKSIDYTKTQYLTNRMQLNLSQGETYGIIMKSPDYSMRVYIDGEEVGSVGTPGTTKEETDSKEGSVILYFTAQSETTNIVVHTSNFVHRIGANVPTITIGIAENIEQVDTNSKLLTGLIFGCFITAGLYHLALFLLNRQQTILLVFGFSCLVHAFVSVNFVGVMFPDINWQIVLRMEYILFIIAVSMLAILISMLFPNALHRWAAGGYLVVCGLYIIIIIATDTIVFTHMLPIYQGISIAMSAYALIRLTMQLKERTAKSVLAFIGLAVVVVFSVCGVLRLNGVYIFGSLLSEHIDVREGMVLFIFCFAVLLSIEQSETTKRLEDVKNALAKADNSYKNLLQKMENDKVPHVTLPDLNLTKREKDVALLLLDGKTRDEIAGLLYISMGTVNYHCTNIYRKANVNSLGELVSLFWGAKEAGQDAANV